MNDKIYVKIKHTIITVFIISCHHKRDPYSLFGIVVELHINGFRITPPLSYSFSISRKFGQKNKTKKPDRESCNRIMCGPVSLKSNAGSLHQPPTVMAQELSEGAHHMWSISICSSAIHSSSLASNGWQTIS
jgi:hypothetical protein